MLTADVIITIIINGLISASIYILIALGLNLLFGVSNVINFAHGDVVMLGGYAAVFFSTLLNLNFLSPIAAFFILGTFGIIAERLFFRPLRGRMLACIMLTMGLGTFLEGLVLAVFGSLHQGVPPTFAGLLVLGGATFPMQRMVIIPITAVAVTFLFIFLHHMKIGKAIRAVAQDSEASALQGINTDRIATITAFISFALAAISGVLVAPISSVYAEMGIMPMIKAFIIVIFGGLGSIVGCVFGGLILGFVESLGIFFAGSDIATIILFAILIFTLLIRPRGLMANGSV